MAWRKFLSRMIRWHTLDVGNGEFVHTEGAVRVPFEHFHAENASGVVRVFDGDGWAFAPPSIAPAACEIDRDNRFLDRLPIETQGVRVFA